MLYRHLLGQAPLIRGRIENPYFLGSNAVQTARPFTHRAYDIFLVSRLDGFMRSINSNETTQRSTVECATRRAQCAGT